jgi:hypothetical protein
VLDFLVVKYGAAAAAEAAAAYEAATAEAAAAAAAAFRAEISRYNNREVNFMSLLLYAVQLRSSPYVNSSKVTASRNSLPESIKTIATSNFCLRNRNAPHYMFAFENAYFDYPVADQRIGASYGGTKSRTGVEWTVEASEDGGSVYLKNVYLDRYLYSTEDKFGDYSYRNKLAFGQKENSDRFKWVFLPEDNSASWFFVQNVELNTGISYGCGHSKSPIYTVCLSSGTDAWSQWALDRC